MADLGNTAVISPTDSSNGSGTMPSWLGSAAPSSIDDAGRALQGAVAREWENRSYPTATGTAPAFVVTYTVAPAALRSGQTYTFTAHAAAVGTDTLNANTLGAKGIKKIVAGVKTATAANDFYTGDKIACVYDGTDMVWSNKGFASSVSSATTSVEGISELLTTTEVLTGTDTTRTATADSIAALWEKGSDVASAGTTAFGEGGYVHITGTTTITDLDFTTAKDGRGVKVQFDGILTLTHHSTTLVLPGGANITTAAGDTAEFVQDSTDNIKCLWYQRADGTPLVAPASGGMTLLATLTTTSGTTQSYTGIGSTYRKLFIEIDAVAQSTGSQTLRIATSGDTGSNYGTPISIAAATGIGTTTSGSVELTNIRLTTQNAPIVSVFSAVPSLLTTIALAPKHATGGGNAVDAIQFTYNGSAAFTAGAIRIYGVK